MKLIKLTRQPYGEQLLINPYRIISVEETGEGSVVYLTGKLSYLVKEAPDKINKLVNNMGWSTIYTHNIAQTDAE
jgi:uncharacterized protein YlzI (FlbEa/FlbD family)